MAARPFGLFETESGSGLRRSVKMNDRHFPNLLTGIPNKYIYGYFGYVREFSRELEDLSHFCPLSSFFVGSKA